LFPSFRNHNSFC